MLAIEAANDRSEHLLGFAEAKEPLINSESFSCAGKMHQFKAPIAGNSKAIAKIGNAELVHFNKQMLIHELIRDSLGVLITDPYHPDSYSAVLALRDQP